MKTIRSLVINGAINSWQTMRGNGYSVLIGYFTFSSATHSVPFQKR